MLLIRLRMVRTRQVTVIPETKVNSATSSLPSTRTQKTLMHSTFQWLNNFSCLGGLTRCTSGCLGLVSLLQPQQLNHLRNKEVQSRRNRLIWDNFLKIFMYSEQLRFLGRISCSSKTCWVASEVSVLQNTRGLKPMWMLLTLIPWSFGKFRLKGSPFGRGPKPDRIIWGNMPTWCMQLAAV